MSAASNAMVGAAAARAAIAQARSFLFVPGNRPERFEKALASGADAVVLDLEDAVGPDQKAAAREAIATFAATRHDGRTAEHDGHDGDRAHRGHSSLPSTCPAGLLVRINASTTDLGRADLDWLARTPGIAGILAPKAESACAIETIATRLPSLAIVPIIESARGCWQVREVAQAPGVVRLAFGHLDFIADTGLRPGDDERELDPARFAIAMASREADLPPPIDGVTVEIQEEALLARDVARSLRFGFLGKLCIHPRQIDGVHRGFAPDADEVDWARRVVAADQASAGGAVRLDGRMIDAPVVLRARKTLDLYARRRGAT
jgi:citrate lyase subunit beta/citryl-CoA lyase